jgi:hypothetical protein
MTIKTESQTTLISKSTYHALNSRTTGEASFASDDFILMDSNEGIVSFEGLTS